MKLVSAIFLPYHHPLPNVRLGGEETFSLGGTPYMAAHPMPVHER